MRSVPSNPSFSIEIQFFVLIQSPERCASTPCPEGWFRCQNHRCIPPNWRCDGGVDCRNGEDEANCDSDQSFIATNSSSPISSVSAPAVNTVQTNKTHSKSSQRQSAHPQKATQTMLEPPTSSAGSSVHPRRR